MGKLIRLELFNFKSYKGHHVLPFGDSYFTSIIGPNGSGKSNSMDAISFVLGIKSSHLRSTNVRDLVYRGRVLKSAAINDDGDAVEAAETNGNGENGAEEEADTQTSTQRNDPTTAWVMAVYEDDAQGEQHWKRSITSGGQTEYRLNNRVVSHKQYNDALEAEQIIVKARNFLVFQSEVEAIASQSSKDLTRLIEEISGSLEFKKDYDRLKLESEKANEEQSFKLQQRRAMNSEINQYKEQKREAENFERKAAERDQAIVTHVLWKLFHFQKVIDESSEEITKHQEDLKEFRRAQEKFERKLEEAKKEQAKVAQNVSKVERNIKNKEKEIEQKENSLVPIDEKLTISKDSASKYQARVDALIKERDHQSQNVEKLKKDLAGVEKAQSRWEKEWQSTQEQQGRQLSEKDLQEYNKLRGEVGKRSAADQIKVDNLTRQLKTDEETTNSLKTKVESLETLVRRLEAEGRDLKERREDINMQLKETQKAVEQKKRDYNNMTSQRVKNAQTYTEKDEQLQQIIRKLDEAENGQRESRKEMNKKELVRTLKSIFPGIKGRLHELCKPKQKKYETAIGIVLGRHWDSLVVDSEKTGRDVIQYLKEQRKGQITCMPIDAVQVKAINANLKSIHRQARLAIDTLDYDGAYERVMSAVCGNAMICDEDKVAKFLLYEKGIEATAVTVDGKKFSKGGLITGGQGPNDQKRRWDDTEVEKLRTIMDKLRGEISTLNPHNDRRQRQEEEALQGELSGLEQKLHYLQDELKSLDRNAQSKKKELDHAKSQLKEAKPKYLEQSQGVENIKAELETLQSSIGTIEDQVFAKFCQRLGYTDIRAFEAQQGSAQQEALQKKQSFSTHAKKLQNQLSLESHQLQQTKDRIKRIEDNSKRDRDLIKSLDAEKESIQDQLDVLRAELDQLTEQLTELQTKYDEQAEKVAEQRREFKKRTSNVEEKVKAVQDLEAEMQRKSAERYALLRKCRIEEIKIPLAEGSNDLSHLPLNTVPNEQDPDAMDVDGDETLMPELSNDYGIEVDFDDLDDELKEDDSESAEDRLQEAIKALNSELEKMAPNMRATDRLEGVESRLKDTDAEFATARRIARQTKELFDDVKQQRHDLFMKAYTHIADQIQIVYKDLTKSRDNPLGGQAYLDLEEEETEPYLHGTKYNAMPPLKRFRDMEHLSGGEKTMAALALLFAVHSYQPSPFFVLDEVDAALDNANVAKLVAYIRRNAGPGMQFIVISLKAGLYEGSETLVGVMRDQGINSSKTLTLDLRKYQQV
ncbi:hypothetical protein FKW77_010262 [Venturia effusa]|uniref:Structural maintenance of chromosomes protein n=1 Tax=Venturia effusa TaxID=50376 RepID=A0A517L6G2_9PEZI|nr:hypothetical protein FKW77_010262 [Venturia effusa]